MDKIIMGLLFLGILAGQIIKIPLLKYSQSGLTLLDLSVFISILLLLLSLRFKLQKPTLWFFSACLFFIVVLISQIFNPLKISFTDSLVNLGYGIRFTSYLLLGFLLYLKNIKLIKPLILAGVGLSLLGILQLIFYLDLYNLQFLGWDPHYLRTVSTLLDPNFLGGFLILTFLLLINLPDIFSRKIRLLVLGLFFICILTTSSRSTVLMFGISMLTLSILKKSLKTGLLTLILLAVLGGGLFFYNQVIAAPRNIDKAQSASFRVNSWQQGLSLFQKNPILGVGFNNYREALKQYQLAPEDYLKSRSSTGNDSSILFVAATTGIIGLIFYLWFLTTLFYTTYKQYLNNPLSQILIAGLTGLLIHSLFVNSLFYPWILVWIIIVLSSINYRL